MKSVTTVSFFYFPSKVDMVEGLEEALESIGGGASSVGVFVGAISVLSGAAGLVPAPETGDENKFLRGDGSWATVSGGSGGLIQIGVIPSQANTVTHDGTPQTCNFARKILQT